MGFTYNFPRPKTIPGEDGYTQRGVADDICSHAGTLYSLADGEDQTGYLTELMKLSSLCETAIRQFDANVVSSAYFTHLSLLGDKR